MAERIWTGSVMTWTPPFRFRYVTALADAVPPDSVRELIERVPGYFLEAHGGLILSSYGSSTDGPQPIFDELARLGRPADGAIRIDRPGRSLVSAAAAVYPGRGEGHLSAAGRSGPGMRTVDG